MAGFIPIPKDKPRIFEQNPQPANIDAGNSWFDNIWDGALGVFNSWAQYETTKDYFDMQADQQQRELDFQARNQLGGIQFTGGGNGQIVTIALLGVGAVLLFQAVK
jgi:hypothetical protein